jgi:hypothetical protein
MVHIETLKFVAAGYFFGLLTSKFVYSVEQHLQENTMKRHHEQDQVE